MLNNATSGEIKQCIDDKIKREIKQLYDKKTKYPTIDKQLLSKQKDIDFRWKRMSKRAIQYWLPRLEKEGLVNKDKYNVYSLTVLGKKKTIFSRLYGEILFHELVEKLPFTGSDKERIVECIKRFGLYILSVFIYNLTIKEHSFSNPNFTEDLFNWPEETISPRKMFQWFYHIFCYDVINSDKNHYREYIKTKTFGEDVEHITKIFAEDYANYFKAFNRSNIRFNQAQKGERF